MILAFILISALILIFQILLFKQIADLRTLIVDGLMQEVFDEIHSDVETISEEEQAIIERIEERDRAFDERIAMLKDELSAKIRPSGSGTIADELHPLVKNLPHDSVRPYATHPPDVEIAE